MDMVDPSFETDPMTDLAGPPPPSSFSSYRRNEAQAAIADDLQKRSSPATPAFDQVDPVGTTAIVQKLTASADPSSVFTQLAELLVPTLCSEASAAVYVGEQLDAWQRLPPVSIDQQATQAQPDGSDWMLTVATPADDLDPDGDDDGPPYVAVLTCRGSGPGPTGQEVALIELAARYAVGVVHRARQQQLLRARQNQVTHLQVALESNRMISAAVGMLMVTHQLTYRQVFDLLSTTSQTTNRRVAAVADTVLQTGRLPVVAEGSAPTRGR